MADTNASQINIDGKIKQENDFMDFEVPDPFNLAYDENGDIFPAFKGITGINPTKLKGPNLFYGSPQEQQQLETMQMQQFQPIQQPVIKTTLLDPLPPSAPTATPVTLNSQFRPSSSSNSNNITQSTSQNNNTSSSSNVNIPPKNISGKAATVSIPSDSVFNFQSMYSCFLSHDRFLTDFFQSLGYYNRSFDASNCSDEGLLRGLCAQDSAILTGIDIDVRPVRQVYCEARCKDRELIKIAVAIKEIPKDTFIVPRIIINNDSTVDVYGSDHSKKLIIDQIVKCMIDNTPSSLDLNINELKSRMHKAASLIFAQLYFYSQWFYFSDLKNFKTILKNTSLKGQDIFNQAIQELSDKANIPQIKMSKKINSHMTKNSQYKTSNLTSTTISVSPNIDEFGKTLVDIPKGGIIIKKRKEPTICNEIINFNSPVKMDVAGSCNTQIISPTRIHIFKF